MTVVAFNMNILGKLILRELKVLNRSPFTNNSIFVGKFENMQIQIRVTRDRTEFVKEDTKTKCVFVKEKKK